MRLPRPEENEKDMIIYQFIELVARDYPEPEDLSDEIAIAKSLQDNACLLPSQVDLIKNIILDVVEDHLNENPY